MRDKASERAIVYGFAYSNISISCFCGKFFIPYTGTYMQAGLHRLFQDYWHRLGLVMRVGPSGATALCLQQVGAAHGGSFLPAMVRVSHLEVARTALRSGCSLLLQLKALSATTTPKWAS